MILVTGATGNVGRPLIDELLAAGLKVRALSRSPATAALPAGVEVAPADDPPLRDVTALFLNPAALPGGPGDLLARAAEHGVRRVVMLSSLAAGDDRPDDIIGAHHRQQERLVEESGLEWAMVRPGAFASNTLQWAASIRAEGVARHPYALAETTPIHERDIAAVAARAFLTDDLLGTRPTLTGPESLTHADQARIIGEAIGRPVRFEELSPEQARDGLFGGAPAPFVDSLLTMWAEAVGKPAPVSPEVERITGRPARTFAEWAADNADAFR